MKSKVIRLIIVLILGAYFFARTNPDNAVVVKVQNRFGWETHQTMTGLTDTEEALPGEPSVTIDLTNCVSYFDGCNTCTVKDGELEACTLMYCETPAEPKCLEYAEEE